MTTPGFSNSLPPTVEDIWGTDFGRNVTFSNFLNREAPGVSGRFRNFLDQRRRPLENNFLQQVLTENVAPLDFQSFLNQRGGANPMSFLSMAGGGPDLDKAADVLRGGSQAQGLAPAQRAMVGLLGQNPQQQFQMALAPQIQQIAQRFRPGFAELANRGFSTVMAEQGTDPNFQYLPHIQENNFQLWS